MAVGGDYSTPVYVNGYACWNCAAVAEAKKDINPADPQAGPGGAKATTGASSTQSPAVILGGVLASGAAGTTSSASQASSPSASVQASPAVIFGGVLANSTAPSSPSQGAPTPSAWRQASPALSSYAASGPGAQVDITV